MKTPTLERNLEIKRKHADGASYRTLAREYGVSPARVQQICDAFKGSKVIAKPFDIRKVHRTLKLASGHMTEARRQLDLLETELAELDLILGAILVPQVVRGSASKGESPSSATDIGAAGAFDQDRLAS